MKVLLLKTSSLGDLIHSFPALTDAAAHVPGIRFDWVVEEAFTQVPAWHPAVDRVIPIALRRWRTNWGKAWRGGGIQRFVEALRENEYDLILDAQGLLVKSALLTLIARGKSAGYGWKSAREPLSSLCYGEHYRVARELHAIERNRRLFGLALNYAPDLRQLEYGLRLPEGDAVSVVNEGGPYLVFLHATTWPTKHWPEIYWAALARLAAGEGYRIIWPWYEPEERLRAERLITTAGGELAPRLGLDGMARLLAGAAGVIGVDSGLAHLAAALQRPAVSLFGPTSPALTGALSQSQVNLSSGLDCAPCLARECARLGQRVQVFATNDNQGAIPCFRSLDPERVWQALKTGGLS